MKIGIVWNCDVFSLLFRHKGTTDFCLISGSASAFIFEFYSQNNTILFILLHQHTPWGKTSALLDHSGMQQWEWTCGKAHPCPAAGIQGLCSSHPAADMRNLVSSTGCTRWSHEWLSSMRPIYMRIVFSPHPSPLPNQMQLRQLFLNFMAILFVLE